MNIRKIISCHIIFWVFKCMHLMYYTLWQWFSTNVILIPRNIAKRDIWIILSEVRKTCNKNLGCSSQGRCSRDCCVQDNPHNKALSGLKCQQVLRQRQPALYHRMSNAKTLKGKLANQKKKRAEIIGNSWRKNLSLLFLLLPVSAAVDQFKGGKEVKESWESNSKHLSLSSLSVSNAQFGSTGLFCLVSLIHCSS